ncbi:MAG TPA: hypothetical protein PLD23_10935 [Armatimonadota bacterium]|nr:hypothetical protein [Armatimonadota bacterium]
MGKKKDKTGVVVESEAGKQQLPAASTRKRSPLVPIIIIVVVVAGLAALANFVVLPMLRGKGDDGSAGTTVAAGSEKTMAMPKAPGGPAAGASKQPVAPPPGPATVEQSPATPEAPPEGGAAPGGETPARPAPSGAGEGNPPSGVAGKFGPFMAETMAAGETKLVELRGVLEAAGWTVAKDEASNTIFASNRESGSPSRVGMVWKRGTKTVTCGRLGPKTGEVGSEWVHELPADPAEVNGRDFLPQETVEWILGVKLETF